LPKPIAVLLAPLALAECEQPFAARACSVLDGSDAAQADASVAGFRRRRPVYGSPAVASGRVTVRHETVPVVGS
jgi:hypothetical protein